MKLNYLLNSGSGSGYLFLSVPDSREENIMKKVFGLVLLAFLGLGLIAVPVSADPLQLACASPTVCTSGSVSLIINNTSSPTFNLIFQSAGGLSGTAFLVVLVPNATASFTVTEGSSPISLEESESFTSGKLGDSGNLNEPGMTGYTFSSLASASAQSIATPTSFTAYEYNLGAYSSPGSGAPGTALLQAGSLPTGTVIVAFVEDSSGNASQQTPLSESLNAGTTVATPEPSSSLLLSFALLGISLFTRYYRQ